MKQEVIAKAERYATRYLETAAVRFCGSRPPVSVLLDSLDFAPQDEIIITANVVTQISDIVSNLGVKCVFSDIDAATLSPDVLDIAAKVTDKTRAVIVSHTFGELAELEKIRDVLASENITVIEECVNLLGAVRFGEQRIYRPGEYGFGCITEAGFSLISSISGDFPKGVAISCDAEQAEGFLTSQPEIETVNGIRRLAAAHWKQLVFENDLLPYISLHAAAKDSCGSSCCYAVRVKERDRLAAYLLSRNAECSVPEFAFEGTGCTKFEALKNELLLLPTEEADYDRQRETILKIKEFYRGQTAE